MNLQEFLKSKAEKYKKKLLLIGDGISLTYQEFDEITDRMAYGLEKLGVSQNDHVAVLHPNSPQVLLTYFSIIKAGAVVVPINPIYTSREIKYILNNSNAKVLILRHDFLPKIDKIKEEIPLVGNMIIRKANESVELVIKKMLGSPLKLAVQKELESNDPAIMFYTSGTTGNPKGVVLTHGNLCFGGPNIAQSYGLREGDITLAALPMVHVFCIASPFLGSLSSGGTVVVLESFNTQAVLKAIVEHKVTWFPGVPTMFTYLLNELNERGNNVSSLRMGLSGGASLPVEVLKEWEEKFHTTIIEVYGLTESTGLVTANPVYGVRKLGSVGITVSGVQAKVVDKQGNEVPPRKIGELVFRGPNAIQTYYKLPNETNEKIRSGWVHTGDHAWQDEDGYFYIVGREKELIISAGYNIYPREIEEVIHGYPGVNEVAVIGIKDPVKGEIPKAFISSKEGHEITPEALLAHCKENLAPYKIPKIQFMRELPKNPTGKILKRELPTN